jgi:hypothetical protein
MVKDSEHEPQGRRGRVDLASRLFRPHRFFLRRVSSAGMPEAPTADARPRRASLEFAGQALDVICCGMYRACSTWQYEVIAHLVEHHRGGRRLGYVSGAQYGRLSHDDSRAKVEKAGLWRVLKSHEGDRAFARALSSGRARAVYAYRDVRDVAFSLMHKRKLTFEQLLRQGMTHQVLANDRFWTALPGVLVQRYEHILAEPAPAILALARHIGIELDRAEAERIAALYSQESNRARTAALRRRLHESGLDLSSAANAQICDESTLLHWNHMRDADSSWRSLATAGQKAVLEKHCGRWLIEHGYERAPKHARHSRVETTNRWISTRDQINLQIGCFNYLTRCMSLRFPHAARLVKGILGLATDQVAGATTWSDTSAGNGAVGDASPERAAV